MSEEAARTFRQSPNRMMLRRALFLMIVCGIVAFIVLAAQLFRLQILRHEELGNAALSQQLRQTAVPAARGEITDRNGTPLAVSATVWDVYVSPIEIRMHGEDPEMIAGGLSDILGIDREKIAALCTDGSAWYKTVAKKLTGEEADKVRRFKSENDLRGVKIESDVQRCYPYGSLASHLIGFTGADNTGLSGVDYTFDSLLTGKNGSVQRLKNSAGTDMLFTGYENYIDAVPGSDLRLTVDVTLQYYLEKHLSQAIRDYDIRNGAAAIAVDPNTGGILAMASLGNFDLNDYQRLSPEAETLVSLAPESERSALRSAAQQRQWRNKAISDTYEPGSTFKIITLAMGLEEGLVSENSSFYCGGSMNVQGRGKPLKCWKTAGHGSQSLVQAVQHSCNVAFATLGLRIGEETFYRYCENFGFFEGSDDSAAPLSGKTGIALPGESGSIWWSRDVFCNEENFSQLAAASFGQTFNITPLQMVMAVSACCNGGYLLKPRVVESVTAPDGTVTEYGREVVRQVLSESTSRKVNAILEQVVSDKKEGTGKNASVAGYRIAGKTGTSEKVAQNVVTGEKEYVVSFVGYAPANDPKIVVLLLLDAPSPDSGIYISGGQMAAPVVGAFLADALPVLGVERVFSEEESRLLDRSVPEVKGLSLGEASAKLKESGFDCRCIGEGKTVTDQLPAAGSVIAEGSCVILYADAVPSSQWETVPDLTGLRYIEARELLGQKALFLRSDNAAMTDLDTVVVCEQNYEAETSASHGTVITVTLLDRDESAYGRY